MTKELYAYLPIKTPEGIALYNEIMTLIAHLAGIVAKGSFYDSDEAIRVIDPTIRRMASSRQVANMVDNVLTEAYGEGWMDIDSELADLHIIPTNYLPEEAPFIVTIDIHTCSDSELVAGICHEILKFEGSNASIPVRKVWVDDVPGGTLYQVLRIADRTGVRDGHVPTALRQGGQLEAFHKLLGEERSDETDAIADSIAKSLCEYLGKGTAKELAARMNKALDVANTCPSDADPHQLDRQDIDFWFS